MVADYLRGVPAAGHIADNGFWHAGASTSCTRCTKVQQARLRMRKQLSRRLPTPPPGGMKHD